VRRRHKPKDWTHQELFSTGEAAQICGVSQQTIIRCFDKGELEGFRVPGSRFRRIPRAALLRFMHAHDMPTDAIESPVRRVLVVDDDDAILDALVDFFAPDERFEITTASTGYDAGVLTERFRPHVILLDYALPDIDGGLVCQRLRTNPDLQATKVLIMSGKLTPSEGRQLVRRGADGYLPKPVDLVALVPKLERMLNMKAASKS
jgi:excisionase family DNA binding protein